MPYPSLSRRALFLSALSVTGCGTNFLPQDGPHVGSVVSGATLRTGQAGPEATLSYALVKVDADVLRRLTSQDFTPTFESNLVSAGNTRASNGIGVGDFVGITIFEAGAGGLFVPAEPGTRSGNYVQLPPQQVDSGGTILVPFAGSIRAAGRSPQAVAKDIQTRLADRALEPQAIVTVTERRSDSINVTGDVTTSTHFSLDPGGERLAGAVARAGGPKYPPYESLVTLQRGKATSGAYLSEIMRDPAQNISLRPGDTIYVSRVQRYYLALGAVGPGQFLGVVNRRVAFEDSRLTMAGALAKVGGLADDRANARAVFLYRFEPRGTLGDIGVPVTPSTAPLVPTVYFVDLVDPAGYFYANEFMMRNDDLIFVSNSPSTDVTKFLALILPLAYSSASFKSL